MNTNAITAAAWRNWQAWSIATLLLCIFVAQAAAVPPAAQQESRTLLAGETWMLELPAERAEFLEVRNAGFDTIASALDAQGRVLSQSVTWRGREGRYLLSLTDEQGRYAARIKVQNLENHNLPGEVNIIWLRQTDGNFSRPDAVNGLRALALAGHHRALDAHTESARKQAIAAYQDALSVLNKGAYADWRADIYFELGVIHRRMGQPDKARINFQRSLKAFQLSNNTQGVAAANNALGLVALHLGEYTHALRLFDKALSLHSANNSRFYQAQALNNIALANWYLDDYPAASQAYSLALPLFAGRVELSVDQIVALDIEQLAATGNLAEIAKALNNLALARSSTGDTEQAESLWLKAIDAAQSAGSVVDVARAELNLGKMLQEQGRLEQALDYLNSAAEAFTRLNDDVWLAQAMSGLGNVYASIDELDSAINHYQQALELVGSNQQQRAYIFQQLANANRRLGRMSLANDQFETARDSFSNSNQPASAAVVTSLQGMLLYQTGAHRQALSSQQQAIQTLEALGNIRQSARAQSRLGQLLLAQGRPDDARRELQSALQGHRAVADELYELDTLTALSRAQSGIAALDTARTAAELALGIRARTVTADIQTGFLASRRDAFEHYINLLVDAGDTELAWSINEQIRARTLLDLIQDPQDSEQRAIAMMALPEAGEFQQQLADDVAVLNYFLGAQRSHLWVISRAAIAYYPLPAADSINSIARQLSQVLRNHRQSPSRIAYIADQLSDMVLRPAADMIAERRLIVVADGGLQQVPFGLLPLQSPDSSAAKLMVANNTVAYAPSARIYQLLSRQPARIANAMASTMGNDILVLADPLANVAGSMPSAQPDSQFGDLTIDFSHMVAQRSMRQSGINIANLPGAQLEAAAIQRIARNDSSQHADSVTVRVGAEVNHDFVTGGTLRDYNVIHFATHGVIDADVPELSALILAGDDADQSVGYLRPQDIAGLELNAELVVLSGCETGIGKSVGSEGLLSLSRPFLIAGARQVISSLWQVSDRATAQLMERFYFHLLQQQLSPEAALRSAQQWMRKQSEWQHPYFWAGFVLQGGHQQVPSA